MQPKRNHPLYMIKRMLLFVRQMFFPIMVMFLSNMKNEYLWVLIVGSIGVVVLVLLTSFLSWRKTIYYIDQNILFLEKGILGKSKQGIAFDKITTMNENQELVERIFALTTVKIDAGSTTKGNEIKLTLSKQEAKWLKEQIMPDSQRISATEIAQPLDTVEQPVPIQQSKSYGVTIKELVLYAIASNSFLGGLAFVFAIWQFGDDIPFVKKIADQWIVNPLNEYLKSTVQGLSVTVIVTLVMVLVIIYLVFSLIISVAMAIIKYFGFEVKRKGEQLDITFGLLDKKSYQMSVDKITALYLNYGLIGQFFKLGTLKVESIGYGDERGEIAILYPLVSDSKRVELLQALLPEYAFDTQGIRPPKRAGWSFIIKYTLIPLLIAIGVGLFAPYGYASFGIVAALFVSAILTYKKTAIAMDADKIIVSNGLLGKNISIIKTSQIQSVITSQNMFQKRAKLLHVSYSYQSNIYGKRISVEFMDEHQMVPFCNIQ